MPYSQRYLVLGLVGLVWLGLPLLLRLGLVRLALWLVLGIALNKHCCEYGTLNSMFAQFYVFRAQGTSLVATDIVPLLSIRKLKLMWLFFSEYIHTIKFYVTVFACVLTPKTPGRQEEMIPSKIWRAPTYPPTQSPSIRRCKTFLSVMARERWCIKLWDITSLGSVQVVEFFDVAARLSTGDGPNRRVSGHR